MSALEHRHGRSSVDCRSQWCGAGRAACLAGCRGQSKGSELDAWRTWRRSPAGPQQVTSSTCSTPTLHAVAQRLAGPKVAGRLLEFLKRRGFQPCGLFLLQNRLQALARERTKHRRASASGAVNRLIRETLRQHFSSVNMPDNAALTYQEVSHRACPTKKMAAKSTRRACAPDRDAQARRRRGCYTPRSVHVRTARRAH